MLDVGPSPHFWEKIFTFVQMKQFILFKGPSTSKNPEYTAEVSPYMKYIRFFIVMILCVSNRKERKFISLICPSGVNWSLYNVPGSTQTLVPCRVLCLLKILWPGERYRQIVSSKSDMWYIFYNRNKLWSLLCQFIFSLLVSHYLFQFFSSK